MKYKHEQTTTILRHRNSIRAYRILDIQGNNLIIRSNLDKEKTMEFAVSDPDNYKVNDYVDMVFTRTGSSSYRIELIGHTPSTFTPNNGIDIF